MSASGKRPAWKIMGWLLTPIVVWAAAFVGGWLAALTTGRLGLLIAGGLVGGAAGLSLWVWLMARRSAKRQQGAG